MQGGGSRAGGSVWRKGHFLQDGIRKPYWSNSCAGGMVLERALRVAATPDALSNGRCQETMPRGLVAGKCSIPGHPYSR
jgi:hypothetical protein